MDGHGKVGQRLKQARRVRQDLCQRVVKHVVAGYVATLVGHDGPQLLVRSVFHNRGGDADGGLRVAKGVGVGLRTHLQIKLGLLNLQQFADGRQDVVKLG